jgi:NhaP-type Na+/H+ or K+/H+ antiporter
MFGWIGIIVGILLLLFAAFMVFFYPAASHEHQPDPYGWNGVIFGFIAGIIGIALIFLP